MTDAEKDYIRQRDYQVIQSSAYNDSWWQVVKGGTPVGGRYGVEDEAWKYANDLISADSYNN
ncbi:hypothetical protein [Pseudomonas sp. BGI-2]|uniref:hypothetical protein n=1 Tax=Pseudomonas sp. BGI-2 TaxID=2528211 RepID=UPI001033AB09|nr:hypothetical protein [Pseudomonas sp. BGI-2]TBN34128.1 hypothetical protein EYC95_27480 [Pseudomonas sp. BGI-2]